MKDLRQAHVQHIYQPISVGFLVIVLLTIIGAVYVGWSSTTITLTPRLTPISSQINVTVGGTSNEEDQYHLDGTIVLKDESATVTVTPKGEGDLVPAHATGTMTIKNNSGSDQPLATGTRLRSTSNIIVRTQERVDVPAGKSITVGVTADPLGEEGNLPAGHFVIVALWPGLQDKIYGELPEPMSGGLTRGQGTLPLADLTAASSEAEQQLQEKIGKTAPGLFVTLTPTSVTTSPKPEVPSATYQVTVTVKVFQVTYDAAALERLRRTELEKSLHNGQEIASIEPASLSLTSQPATDQVVFLVSTKGQQQISKLSSLLSPASYAGLTVDSTTKKLRDSNLFTTFTIKVSPSWRTTLPEQTDRIIIRRQPGTP